MGSNLELIKKESISCIIFNLLESSSFVLGLKPFFEKTVARVTVSNGEKNGKSFTWFQRANENFPRKSY